MKNDYFRHSVFDSEIADGYDYVLFIIETAWASNKYEILIMNAINTVKLYLSKNSKQEYKEISIKEWNKLIQMLDRNDFWRKPQNTFTLCEDTDCYKIIAKVGNKLHSVHRYSLDNSDIFFIGKKIIKLAGLQKEISVFSNRAYLGTKIAKFLSKWF